MVDKANEKAFNDAVDKPVEVIPELFVNDKGFVSQNLTISTVLNFLGAYVACLHSTEPKT